MTNMDRALGAHERRGFQLYDDMHGGDETPEDVCAECGEVGVVAELVANIGPEGYLCAECVKIVPPRCLPCELWAVGGSCETCRAQEYCQLKVPANVIALTGRLNKGEK